MVQLPDKVKGNMDKSGEITAGTPGHKVD